MKNSKSLLALSAAILMLLAAVGCGRFNAPTASQPEVDQEMGLWNPGPNDRLFGHEIPLVGAGYWESIAGPEVNPWQSHPRSAEIGPSGGVLRLGIHMLIVPPGAVDEVVTFTMRHASASGIAVDCGPSPMTFNVPLTLILSYRGTQYDNQEDDPDSPENDLRIYYMAADGSLEEQPCSVDRIGNIVIGEINHFSRYILG